MNLDSIRRAVRAKGLAPASVVPEASAGRAEEACIRRAGRPVGNRLLSLSAAKDLLKTLYFVND